MDKITLDRINTAHPKLREELYEIYNQICAAVKGRIMCRFAYVIRTMKEQGDIYAQGRTTPGDIVTNAKPGWSFHNYGLAVDIVLIRDLDGNGTYETASWDEKIDVDKDGVSEWAEIVSIFKAHGWEWGGDWGRPLRDAPHFQKSFGNPVALLLDKFNKQQFIEGTNYVRL